MLRPDGYELYAAQQISGRMIYQAREYTEHEYASLPGNLFTERYKDLNQFGEGVATDKISAHVKDTSMPESSMLAGYIFRVVQDAFSRDDRLIGEDFRHCIG